MKATKEILALFLKWAIDDNQLISGDYDGYAGPTYQKDTYETIAEKFLAEQNNAQNAQGV